MLNNNYEKYIKENNEELNKLFLVEKKLKEKIRVDLNNKKEVDAIRYKPIKFMLGSYRDRYTITSNYSAIYIHDKKECELYKIINDAFNNKELIEDFIVLLFLFLKNEYYAMKSPLDYNLDR